ncbi:hypothetical protein BDA99DRAFT_605354 [Phascolomyces articulosus]|uniref:Uncharacterized protein n=1 Tax=Phascolomyces articulosus TaxID=60185 RepID=A0AAD5KC40_9FUNG|nr:hypothetical protein BDA99DRAFT_605354 [Phascolomyces articulosus]
MNSKTQWSTNLCHSSIVDLDDKTLESFFIEDELDELDSTGPPLIRLTLVELDSIFNDAVKTDHFDRKDMTISGN